MLALGTPASPCVPSLPEPAGPVWGAGARVQASRGSWPGAAEGGSYTLTRRAQGARCGERLSND